MFGIRLRNLRNEHNFTQEELAEKIGVSPKTIGTWERETREPPIKTINKLSKIFNVPTDYLLGNSENKSSINNDEVVDMKEAFDGKVVMTYEGKPIPKQDIELMKRLLRIDEDDE
ncbi:helix-turn-helix domain-containing protein [Companilactobacillus metriopterae]|uniref:helix-turn-helix domain-containing protein n=1 Tax=Companilactobacillus metriopterae TaxID=1909267 RepID=UPI00100C0BDB|nr:helix-turn-helix transcriptional regulator [Companilactobacillus metriopterae]